MTITMYKGFREHLAELQRPRFQAALDRAWFALKPRKPTWWERLLRVLVWP